MSKFYIVVLCTVVLTVLGLLFHVLRTRKIRHRYYTQDYTGQHWKNNTTKNNNIKLQHDKIAPTQHSIYQYKIARLQDCNITTLQDYKITTLQPGNREDKSTK